MPDVTVVIPARDAAATLPRTLAALKAQTLAADRFEVVVAEDHAGAGPGATRNAGAARATAPLLAFTDADCFPEPGWLEAIVAALEHADVVQGRVLPERPPGPYDRTVNVPAFFGLFETANLAIRRPLFERLGGFEAGFAPLGGKELGEDTWLGWRARRLGAQVVFAEDAVVRHAVFPRGPGGYVAERRRLVAFPALLGRMPELRSALCWRRPFLTRRSAAFDAAVCGVALAAATRRAAPLALALPYLAGERPTPVTAAADATGAAALLAGSVRARRLLL